MTFEVALNDTVPFIMEYSVDIDDTTTTDNMTYYYYNMTNVSELQLLIEEIISYLGMTLGALSIVLNIGFLLIMHFLKDKSTAYHRFMKNLSFADIMAASSFLLITTWPKWFFAYIEDNRGFILVQVLPYVFRSLPWMFFTGYLLTLSCLTINQYVAVCRPWRYSELVTPHMVTISLVIIWSLSLLQILIPLAILLILYGLEDKDAAMNALYSISKIEIQVWMVIFAASAIMNIVVDFIIYRKIRQLKLKRRYSPASNNPESLNIRMKHEAFVTVSLLVVASTFCRLPFPLAGLIGINVQERILNAGIVMLLYLNFFVDPIIYIGRMKDVRKTCRRMFSNCNVCTGQETYKRSLSMRMLSIRTETTMNTVVNNERHDSIAGPTAV